MNQPAMPDFPSPFRVETEMPLVAVQCRRNGYLMIASRQEVFRYQDIPDSVFEAARAWARILEDMGASRVYWLVLSEVTLHYHIHIFPRWPGDALKGIPLFESRDDASQPPWQPDVLSALDAWKEEFRAHVARQS